MKMYSLHSGQKLIRVNMAFYVNEMDLITLIAKNIGKKKMTKNKLMSILKETLRKAGNASLIDYNSNLPLHEAKIKLHNLIPEMKSEMVYSEN